MASPKSNYRIITGTAKGFGLIYSLGLEVSLQALEMVSIHTPSADMMLS